VGEKDEEKYIHRISREGGKGIERRKGRTYLEPTQEER